MSQRIIYTSPAVCSYDQSIEKNWFVYFDVTDTETDVTIRKQFRGGINYYKTVKDRELAAEQLRRFWDEKLKTGWSPFINTGVNKLNRMRFNEAIDFALSKCQLAKKTKAGYSGTAEFFKAAAKKMNLDNALMIAIKRQHIKILLDDIKEERSWSNHAYNKNIGYFAGILSRLVDFEIIENNPAHNIKFLPVTETMMYEAYTEAEKTMIREKLLEIHPAFFAYLMVIYHTGIRPKEVLALKIRDINFERRLILIKPDLEEENSKTKTIRMVPINEHLAALILQHVKGYAETEMFVFGSPFDSGKGNRGSEVGRNGSSRSDYFKPSFTQVKRDTATKLWNKIVIKGMKIEKYMYAMKHTGADDKILAGISLDALRDMYGHTSKLMTEKYARKVKDIYREQIVMNSPSF